MTASIACVEAIAAFKVVMQGMLKEVASDLILASSNMGPFPVGVLITSAISFARILSATFGLPSMIFLTFLNLAERIVSGFLSADEATMLLLGSQFVADNFDARYREAAEAAHEARVAALAPICAQRFRDQKDAAAKITSLSKANFWDRTDVVGKFAIMPGSKEADQDVARACADILTTPATSKS